LGSGVLVEPMMTKEQVAALLHMQPETAARWARLGKLPGHRVGKRWLFDRVEIEVEVLHRNSTHSTR
jgi:excisionase family DNA binding protein